MKNERTSSTAPLLLGMAARGRTGLLPASWATNTSQRQIRRTARKLAKGAEHAVSPAGPRWWIDFVERRMDG